MKILRLTGVLLLFVAGITIVLSMILPASQTIERTIRINAPAAQVYAQLSKLQRFNEWTVWNRNDSSVRNVLSGTDGTVGATSTWSGDPVISGEGKIEITALEENRRVEHDFNFLTPRQTKANSVFLLDAENNQTKVTWTFRIQTPRPWNIFNLFYKMEKEMGKDFEAGLANLKAAVEKTAGTTGKSYEVAPLNFPATTFAMIRQRIRMDDISSYFSTHLPILFEETGRAGISAGSPTGLYFEWDDQTRQTDMAAALPVPAGTTFENSITSFKTLPASKAVSVNFYGSYERIRDAYSSLDAYVADKKLTRKFPVIEQYITGAQQESDTTKWHTRVVYLVE